MVSLASLFVPPLILSISSHHHQPPKLRSRRSCLPLAALSSPSPSPNPSESATAPSKAPAAESSPSSSSRPPDSSFNYALASPDGNPIQRFVRSAEPSIERLIFDFRLLALLAIGGSLAGSLLCFLNEACLSHDRNAASHKQSQIYNRKQKFGSVISILRYDKGCLYIVDAYKVFWNCCLKGIHKGQMVLRLVEAIDVYLAGTVMLIFGMGLYGLFISNLPPDIPSNVDHPLRGSSLFGMFALKERPKWMKISSLDELKTKVGHVIVMILLVKMFERSKMVTIATGIDLLSYAICIFLSSASLYILNNLQKSE